MVRRLPEPATVRLCLMIQNGHSELPCRTSEDRKIMRAKNRSDMTQEVINVCMCTCVSCEPWCASRLMLHVDGAKDRVLR